mgnify:CR=1 FL=1
MRERLQTLRPTVLALSFGMLLALPASAAAQSGPQPAIAMEPASAAPGAAVEVTGRDFPAQMTVDLELATEVGTFDLATTATARDGTFRHLVVLPALPNTGAWTVTAQAVDGTAASYAFEAVAPAAAAAQGGTVPAPDSAVPVQASTVPAATVAGGRSTSDGIFLVIVGCLLGVVSTGVLYAWRMLHEERVQPGMGQGDDLIWVEGREEEPTEPTATSEPFWKAAPQEVEAAARDVAAASEQEASASA